MGLGERSGRPSLRSTDTISDDVDDLRLPVPNLRIPRFDDDEPRRVQPCAALGVVPLR